MKVSVDTTSKVLGFREEEEDENSIPATIPDTTEIDLDVPMDEFLNACRESQGEGELIGDIYLHESLEEANKTSNQAILVGSMYVEAEYIAPKTVKERILERRAELNRPANAPVSLDELEFLNVR